VRQAGKAAVLVRAEPAARAAAAAAAVVQIGVQVMHGPVYILEEEMEEEMLPVQLVYIRMVIRQITEAGTAATAMQLLQKAVMEHIKEQQLHL